MRISPDSISFLSRPLVGLSVFGVSASLACATCGPPGQTEQNTPKVEPALAPARLTLDVLAFGRVLGAVAPCGCTTEPLGGLQYTFGYLGTLGDAGRRVVLEPGGLLFPDPTGLEAPRDEAGWAQAEQRAAALHGRFSALPGLVSGLGPTDLIGPSARGALARWPLPRVLANSRAFDAEGVIPHKILDIPGEDARPALQVGVTAVVAPELAGQALGELEPIVPAAAREVQAMRAAGADLVVVLVHGTRKAAVAVAEGVAGADLIVTGIPEGQEKTRLGAPATRVGHGYVLEPGDQAQSLTQVKLSIDRAALASLPASSEWKVIPSRSTRIKELERLDARLAKFRADPAADPQYLARLEAERAELAAALERDAPPSGPVSVTFEQVKITCKLPIDPAGEAALKAYDAWVAAQNQARFAGIKAPAPKKGEPTYVGAEQCAACHEEEHKHWQGTRHAGAYETLVAVNKQFDLSCVGCHVTAFRKPGGSEVVELADLEAIQCEVCHGPGSAHAAQPERAGKAVAIRREVSAETCTQCHTPEHSDTFQYEAYMRDVLGAGHGDGRRSALGEGPTGRELRAAGFEKAGGACKKAAM